MAERSSVTITQESINLHSLSRNATDNSPHRRADDRGEAAAIARREFLKRATFAGAGALCGTVGRAGGVDKRAESDRDRFGGWSGKKFKATGFFRTEHDGERWWLVTPRAYVDIFAPAFETQCDTAARKMAAPYATGPMLLGYCMADCPILTDGDARWSGGTTWPRVLRNLAADAPGKQAYVAAMHKRYADVTKFNTNYATAFATWDELAAAENWRTPAAPVNQAERDDNHAFLLLCVDRYYTIAKAALRRVDPNHLFFGDKINANSDTLNSILEVTSRHTDVVNYQFYARWSRQKALLDRWAPQVNLPFLNGDSAYSVPSEMMPNPYGPHAKDHAERAEWLREFCEGAFARPDFVGWHMCGIIDTWKTMPGKAQHQHQGLMTTTGEFYPEMEKAVRHVSSRLYDIASDRSKRSTAELSEGPK